MFAPTHQLRAFVSALLLLVQLLGLGHIALAEHALDMRGALTDVVPQVSPVTAETHSEAEPHFCGRKVALHADAPHACLVFAAWTAASVAAQRMAPAPRCGQLPGFAGPSVTTRQLDTLCRAPKTSPPQG